VAFNKKSVTLFFDFCFFLFLCMIMVVYIFIFKIKISIKLSKKKLIVQFKNKYWINSNCNPFKTILFDTSYINRMKNKEVTVPKIFHNTPGITDMNNQ
jgi:hypothetical protein